MKKSQIKFKDPILIEGLPGMGNVGKITIDFLIETLKAKKIVEMHSSDFPNCVFVNERNLIDLPKITFYHKTVKKQDYIFISGDIQPFNEQATYSFCNKVLEMFPNTKEIITLGGIGLENIPKKPKVYASATDKKTLNKYKLPVAKGNVGPIIGVSGVLIGLGKIKKIPGIVILVQTFALPTYLGITGVRELLKILKRTQKFNINLEELDNEIKDIEHEFKKKIQKTLFLQEEKQKRQRKEHLTYIG